MKPNKKNAETPGPGVEEKPAAGVSEVEMLKAEIEALKIEAGRAAELTDRLLRLQADFDNFRKRQEKERQELTRFGNEALIRELLTVVEDFERAFEEAKNTQEVSRLTQGVELVWRHFSEVLKKFGLERMDPVGKPFDPHQHEAVGVVETDALPEDAVVDVLMPGYLYHGHLLKPARVRVAKRPATSD